MALVEFTTDGPVAVVTLNNAPANCYSYAFRAAVIEHAKSLCPPRRASLAVGLIKRACQTGAEVGLEQGLALERELQQRLFQSSDAREGIAAFTEKRKPEFTGESS